MRSTINKLADRYGCDLPKLAPTGRRPSREEFFAQAALAALTGLLSNPHAHEEQMRWDDLASEAWAIAEHLVKAAPMELESDEDRGQEMAA